MTDAVYGGIGLFLMTELVAVTCRLQQAGVVGEAFE